MKSVGCQTGIKYESNIGEETRTLENNTKEVDSFQSVKDGDATLQYIAVKLEADDVDQLLSSTDWASEGETETISDVEIFAPFESRASADNVQPCKDNRRKQRQNTLTKPKPHLRSIRDKKPKEWTQSSTDKQYPILMNILHHCEFLRVAMNRLEEKIDTLQSNVAAQSQSQMPGGLSEGVINTAERSEDKIEHLHTKIPGGSHILSQEMSPKASSAYSCVDQRNHLSIPLWQNSLSQAPKFPQLGPAPWRSKSGSPKISPSVSQQGPQPAPARGKPKGRPPKRKSQAEGPGAGSQETMEECRWVCGECSMQENADGFVELGKGIKISPPEEMEAVESTAALVVRPDTSTPKDDKLVLIGSPMRKVHIPVSVYRKVFRQALPQAAVGLVLPAVFPQALLTSGGLPEDPAQGVKMLDPNKIEAIREWLAEMFPCQDMRTGGADWAKCLGVIDRTVREAWPAEGTM